MCKKKHATFTEQHLWRSLFFSKVNHVTVYFWVYKLSLQSNCSEKFNESNRKHLWWSSFSEMLEIVTLKMKGLHQRFFTVKFIKFFMFFIEYLWANGFVPFRFLWNFTSILKTIKVLLLLHFGSCPVEAIMIWLTKQMNTLPN